MMLNLSQNQRTYLLKTALPLAAIAIIVIIFWIPFGFKTSGLVEEWGVVSVLRRGYSLFFVDQNSILRAHAIRPFTVLPHAIAYTLDPYSFVWFNIQQMLFFAGKGIFAFLMLRRLLPRHDVLAFAVAILFVIHPADTGLFTFRAIHIHAAAMFYFAALYLLLVYWDKPRWGVLLLMWGALVFSLFTYEVAYLVVAAAPLLLVYKARRLNRKVFITTGLWYAVPLVTGIRTLFILLATPSTDLYQTSVIGQITTADILPAIGVLYHRSFLDSWAEALNNFPPPVHYLLLSIVISSIILLVSLIFIRSLPRESKTPLTHFLIVFLFGLGFILLGFAPFLLAPTHRFLTLRTYYLSSFGAALCLLLVIYVLIRSRALFAVLAVAFIFVAAMNAFEQEQYYVDLNRRQQRFLGELVEIAPMIEPDTTVIVLDQTGLFNTEWLIQWSEELRNILIYLYGDSTLNAVLCFGPGMYSSSAATAGAGNCAFAADGFQLVFESEPNLNRQISYDKVIVLEYSYDRDLVLLHDLSRYTGSPTPENYQADRLIHPESSNNIISLFSCWPVEPCTQPLADLIPNAPTRFEFDQDSFPGFGWRASETTPAGITFRWMIYKDASVLVRLVEHQPYRVQFLVSYTLTGSILDRLQLKVNGKPVELSRANTDAGVLFTGIITPDMTLEAVDSIDFHLDKLDEIEGVPTGLGIAVDWVDISEITPATSVAIDFDQPISGDGWRGRESTPDGMTFQWSTIADATINLGFLADQSYVVEMRPVFILEPNTLSDIQLRVGDTILETEMVTDTPQVIILRATLPADIVEREAKDVTLTVSVPQTVYIEGSLLGVAVDWLRLSAQ